jgi:hypothetical protein
MDDSGLRGTARESRPRGGNIDRDGPDRQCLNLKPVTGIQGAASEIGRAIYFGWCSVAKWFFFISVLHRPDLSCSA